MVSTQEDTHTSLLNPLCIFDYKTVKTKFLTGISSELKSNLSYPSSRYPSLFHPGTHWEQPGRTHKKRGAHKSWKLSFMVHDVNTSAHIRKANL